MSASSPPASCLENVRQRSTASLVMLCRTVVASRSIFHWAGESDAGSTSLRSQKRHLPTRAASSGYAFRFMMRGKSFARSVAKKAQTQITSKLKANQSHVSITTTVHDTRATNKCEHVFTVGESAAHAVHTRSACKLVRHFFATLYLQLLELF